MFFKIYKTTFKNIYRSPIFWMLLALFAFVAWQVVVEPRYGVYGGESGKMIWDTDPSFVLEYNRYIQTVSNTMSSDVLYYVMPLFTAISTVLVLNRDHGDNFFEIEKSAGVKPIQYVFARLWAIFTLNLIVVTIISYFYLHLYVFTRGGVDQMGLWDYITDSTVRMLRMIIFRAIPTIVFYIGFTYCIGSVFRSGIAAAIGSISYVAFYAVGYLMLRLRVGEFYWDYLSPSPTKLKMYFHTYDGPGFVNIKAIFQGYAKDVVLCISLLVGLGVIYSTIAYLCTRKRNR